MRSSHSLDRLDVIFDDEHAVADAGLVLAATLAQHLGLRGLIEECVDLGDVPGRANVGHKSMTLIHSALAGGDCIDDSDALRAGDTQACWVTVCWPLRRWARSCGASRGVTPASSTGSAASYSAGRGGRAPVGTTNQSPSMWTRRSVRPTGSPSKAACSDIPRSAAITR